MNFNGLTSNYLAQSAGATVAAMSTADVPALTLDYLSKVMDRVDATLAGCEVPDGMRMFEHYSPWPAKLLFVEGLDIHMPTLCRNRYGFYMTRIGMRMHHYEGQGTVWLGWEPNSRTIVVSKPTPFERPFGR